MLDLYKWAKNATNNFERIPKNIFLEKPQILRIIRILLDEGQINFGKKLGISQSTVSALERGQSDALSYIELEKIWCVLSEQKISTISDAEFQDREIRISHRGRFFGEYAKKMAEKSAVKAAIKSAQVKKPTIQEEQIGKAFDAARISFEKQVALEVKGINFVVDFAIPFSKKLQIVIEVKNLQTKFRKKASICEMAYKSFKIKQGYSGTKTIAVVDGNLTKTEQLILSQEFDKVFYNSPIGSLIAFVNELCRK